MTLDDVILQAKRRLNAGALGNVWESFEIDIASCVTSALNSFSREVMNDEAKRGLLMQDYTVTLNSNGVGNFLTPTGSVTGNAGEILAEGIYYGVVKDVNGEVLHPLKNYFSFVSPQPTVFGYYCIQNQKIYTRAAGQTVTSPVDIVSADGDLTITASYTPSDVTDIPAELTDDLVNALCKIVLSKVEELKPKRSQ